MHGRHIKIVGEGAASLLGSPTIIEEFLASLVDKLGMRALGKPIVHDVEIDLAKLGAEPFEDEGGVTGIVVLSTSHCAIHTWPARANPEFVLDVFSCRQFQPREVEAHCRAMLGATRIATTDVSDALKGPREFMTNDTFREYVEGGGQTISVAEAPPTSPQTLREFPPPSQ